MKFLLMIKSDESMPAGPPPPSLMAAIGELGERGARDGTLLLQGGLLPSAAGAQVRVADGRVTVTDGPFTEAKELVGGFAMFELPSREDAVEAGRRFMQLHAEHWPGFTGTCEVRPLMEMGEGPPGAPQA